jgi:hypothetical protein
MRSARVLYICRQDVWAAVRGKRVIIGETVARARLNFENSDGSTICDSDTFWMVKDETSRQRARDVLGNRCGQVVCRHVLDIGD